MNRARFWTFTNGAPVLVTVREGAPAHWRTAHPTDEGYHFESVSWVLRGDYITRHWSSGGRDCDGPIEYYGQDRCHVRALRAGPDSEGVTYPDWRRISERVHDVYAERMGY